MVYLVSLLRLLIKQTDELPLHYGRCSILPGKSFLTECYSTNLSSAGDRRIVSDLKPENNIKRNALIFGASRKSDLGKATRWKLIDRNQAMQPDVRFLTYNSPKDTDILQEYFVPVGAFPNFFSQLQSIQTAKQWTRRLVDLSLKNEGTYYLTYQGFPTLKQFELAYPQWEKFMDVKCKYDPFEVFSNKFYEQYLKAAYNKLKHSDEISCFGV